MKFATLLDRIEASAASRVDDVVALAEIDLLHDGIAISGQRFDASEYALGQLASRIGMPWNYCSGLPAELLAANFAHAKSCAIADHKTGTPTVTIRRKANEVVAALSGTYGIADDVDAYRALTGLAKIDDFDWEWRDGARWTVATGTLPMPTKSARRVGDLQIGIRVSNSEYGASALKIAGFVNRLVCTNGMTRSVGEAGFRRAHTKRVGDWLGTAPGLIENALDASRATVELVRVSEDRGIPNFAVRADDVMRANGFRKAERGAIEALFETTYNGGTAFDLTQAITEAAQGFDVDRRTMAENVAAQILVRETA